MQAYRNTTTFAPYFGILPDVDRGMPRTQEAKLFFIDFYLELIGNSLGSKSLACIRASTRFRSPPLTAGFVAKP